MSDDVGGALDPFLPDQLEDPYPLYARLRGEASDLVYLPEREVWVASRYPVVRSLLRDHGSYPSGAGVQWVPVADSGLRATFIENDPPEHTRVRRAVQRWFTPRAVEDLGDFVEQTVQRILDDALAAEEIDVMTSLARKLPVLVINELTGLDLPLEDAVRWADASFRLGGPQPPDDAASALDELISWAIDGGFAAATPGSLASAILAGGEGSALEDPERAIALFSIVIAGLDTTVHMIGNGLAALADHPEQWALLRDAPAQRAAATVEEVLRYDTPVRFFLRRPRDGRTIVLLYGAANRDGGQFSDPDDFKIERAPTDHVAFGAGIHLCLGAPLARLEGRHLFTAVASRVRALEPAGSAVRTDSSAIRGFDRLPLQLIPA